MTPNKWGVVLIAVVVVGIVAIITTQMVLQRRLIEVHPETNCPSDESATYPSTVILIDRTDPITRSQKRYLKGFVEDLKRQFSLFEKVAIYPIDATGGATPLPLFERCNPGSPEEANVWFENPAQIRETFEIGFAGPFGEELEKSLEDATSETSPIMETIQAVMSNHDLDAKITRQRLVVVSDMLQNTKGYSHYRQEYSYAVFAETEYSSVVASKLVGVGVTVVYLWRPGLSPNDVNDHILFWEQYIRQAGGVLEHVYKVK